MTSPKQKIRVVDENDRECISKTSIEELELADSGKIPLSTVTTEGDLIVATGAAAVTRLAGGASSTVLTGNGAGKAPSFQAPPSDDTKIPLATVTTAGDLIVGTGAASVGRIGAGGSGDVLTGNGAGKAPTYQTPSADVPLATFTGTGGLAYGNGAGKVAELLPGKGDEGKTVIVHEGKAPTLETPGGGGMADPGGGTPGNSLIMPSAGVYAWAGRSVVRAVITHADIALTGIPSAANADGLTLTAGDPVLTIAQTTGADNRVWIVAAGAWTKAPWFPDDGRAEGAVIDVVDGNAYAGTRFRCTSAWGSATIGTHALTWKRIFGSLLVVPPPPVGDWTPENLTTVGGDDTMQALNANGGVQLYCPTGYRVNTYAGAIVMALPTPPFRQEAVFVVDARMDLCTGENSWGFFITRADLAVKLFCRAFKDNGADTMTAEYTEATTGWGMVYSKNNALFQRYQYSCQPLAVEQNNARQHQFESSSSLTQWDNLVTIAGPGFAGYWDADLGGAAHPPTLLGFFSYPVTGAYAPVRVTVVHWNVVASPSYP